MGRRPLRARRLSSSDAPEERGREGGEEGGGREGVQGRLSLLRVRSFLQLWLAFFFANACLDQEGAEEQEPRKS